MAHIIVGLGNPGKEYEKTRHNAGRDAVVALAKKEGFDDFVLNKKANALVSEGKIGKTKVTLVLPETFMNSSGKAVAAFVKTVPAGRQGVKAAKDLLVIQDELDLPVGVLKMVFGRSSGGHKGVESIMRAIKTDQFARIRIGIDKKDVLKKWTPGEEPKVKKAVKKASEAAALFATEGLPAAQQLANTR